MDHHAREIEQHPTARSRAFSVVYPKPGNTQSAHYVVRHALKVARRLAAGYYKEISELADVSEIEQRYVRPERFGRLVEGHPCVIFEF